MSDVAAGRENRRRKGLAATVAVLCSLAACGVARADGPGVGQPWIVSLGDSFISGEGGRWAGNTNGPSTAVDALGPKAYFDNPIDTMEQIPGCHRSKSAEVHIGGAVKSINFACSGAKTTTVDGAEFKPGLDSYASGAKFGQLLQLKSWAQTHNVKMIAISIGGNDFGFAPIVSACVADYATSTITNPNYCLDDFSVTSRLTPNAIVTVEQAIRNAILRTYVAMAQAGYAANTYTIMVQNYPSPIPPSSGFRYPETGLARLNTGGCGFWNRDADWANTRLLPIINSTVTAAITGTQLPNVKLLDTQVAFLPRRLCENAVGLLEEKAFTSWTQAGTVDKTEWFNKIRSVAVPGQPYQPQESIHPNYWGQLALRNCLRQAWNNGAPRGGRCSIAAPGLTAGEPTMVLR